jgi:hypothetical protein
MRGIGSLTRNCFALMVTVVVLVGCSTTTSKVPRAGAGSGTPHVSVTPSTATQKPADLIGLWRVTDAAGEPAGSVLRVAGPQGAGSLTLFRQCGELLGDWVGSTSGGFLAITSGFSEACLGSVGSGDPTPGWLAAAMSFTVRGTQRQLVAADGHVVAQLLPGGHPRAVRDIAPALTTAPKVTASERRMLDTPARPLPFDAAPATTATLSGRWLPYPVKHYATRQQPFLSFAADGRWSGSDGCNNLGGSWRLGGGGEFLTMTGATAGVGCLGASVGTWVPLSGRASVSGSSLTFYAFDGHVLGRLSR